MNEAFQVRLAVIENDVSAAAIPDACRCVATWHIVQLSALYAKLRETGENRYVEEITRLVRGLLKELTTTKKACPEAQQLAASIIEQLRLLHEQFGLPGLKLKPLGAPPLRLRKAESSDEEKQRTTEGRLQETPVAKQDSPSQIEVVPPRRCPKGRSLHCPISVRQEIPKAPNKTLQEREKELQALLVNPAGREELQKLASRYNAANGRPRPRGTSAITYIFVHEREQGLISG